MRESYGLSAEHREEGRARAGAPRHRSCVQMVWSIDGTTRLGTGPSVKFLPVPEPSTSAYASRPAVGFGITWDPEWIGEDRLRIRGYRAANAPGAVTRDEFEALALTADDTLAGAGWSTFEREVIRVVLLRLYAADLAGWPRMDVISPGLPPSLELSPAIGPRPGSTS